MLYGCGMLRAQDPYYVNFDRGLPTASVSRIDPLPNGKLCFSSYMGAGVFDGENIEMFSVSDGLKSPNISWTNSDSKGRIWMHSASGRLVYLENEKLHDLPEVNIQLNQFSSYNEFEVGPNDTLFLDYFVKHKMVKVIPNGKGQWDSIQIIDMKDTFFPLRSRFVPSEIIARHQIKVNKKEGFVGLHLILNNDTLFRRIEAKKYLIYRFEPIDNAGIITANDKMYILEKGMIADSFQFNDAVENVFVVDDTEIWVNMLGGGICYFENRWSLKNPRMFFDNYDKYGSLNHVTKDYEGGYWFASGDNEGVMYVPNLQNQSYRVKEELQDSYLSTTYVYEGILYIAYSNGVITRINSNSFEEEVLYKFDEEPMKATIRTFGVANGELYAGGSHGVLKWDKEKQEFDRISEKACRWFFESQDTLYVGNYYDGFGKIYNGTYTQAPNPKNMDFPRVNQFAKYDSNEFVLASNGIWRWKDGNMTFVSQDLFFQQSMSSYRLGDNKFVLYTFGAGIMISDGADTVFINKNKGLISDLVNEVIQSSDGTIWVSTSSGVSKIIFAEPNSLEKYEITNFSSDYMVVKDVYGMVEYQNKMWVFGSEGMATLDSISHSVQHPIFLDHIKASGALENGIYKLEYGANSMEFAYGTIQYNKTKKLKFEYQLLGQAKDWVVTENNSVLFRQLPPGNYSFRVRVAGESQLSKAIRFCVPQPIWKTWWFVVIISGVLIIIAIVIIQNRLRQLRKRQDLINELNEVKQQALSAQMNPHFIFNSLNSIQRYIIQNDRKTSNKYLSRFSSLMRLVLDNSRHHLIKLGNELEALELYMDLEALRFKEKLTFSLSTAEGLEVDQLMISPLLLQPFVENAIWHGIMHKEEQSGHVLVHIADSDTHFKCIIEDNGIGRREALRIKNSSANAHKSVGTEVTNKRIELANKLYDHEIQSKIIDLYDENGSPQGTRVEIVIPKKPAKRHYIN